MIRMNAIPPRMLLHRFKIRIQLFRAADLALYDVKSNGKNSCKVFVPSMIS